MGGRYICISLLQPHILEYLVQFCETHGWPLRIVRCKEAEANRRPEDTIFPVFAVVATKLKKMEGMPQVFEMAMSNGSQVNRLSSGSDLINSVRGVQQFAAARAGALRVGGDNAAGGGNKLFDGGDARQEEVALELRASGQEEPKYSLYLAQKSGHKKGQIKFAVFIVPQGRETEWLFSTSKGRTVG